MWSSVNDITFMCPQYPISKMQWSFSVYHLLVSDYYITLFWDRKNFIWWSLKNNKTLNISIQLQKDSDLCWWTFKNDRILVSFSLYHSYSFSSSLACTVGNGFNWTSGWLQSFAQIILTWSQDSSHVLVMF